MKTIPTLPQKVNVLVKAALVFCCLIILPGLASAQQKGSIIVTLLKQPCNNDGILVATDTSSGLTLPVTFTWYINGAGTAYTVNTNSDTLYNYNGAPITVIVAPGEIYGTYAGSPPFTFTDSTKAAVCPALSTAQIYPTGGTPPYTVQWFTGSNVLVSSANPASLPGGTYKVLITDSNGCTYSTPNFDSTVSGGTNGPPGIYVPQTVNVKDSIITTAANCTNGTAAVVKLSGGVVPYSFTWSNGANTDTITGLIRGNYTVTVTDSEGCLLVSSAEIQQAVTITVHTTVTNDSCRQNSGSVISFGSGGHSPYTYLWSGGQHTDTINNLAGGYYYVTVTDSVGCLGSGYAYVSVTTPITVSYTSTPSSCTSATGTATLTVAGGHTPYNVTWNTYPPQSGITASNLSPGTYGFLVTDSVGCIRTGSVYVPAISPVTGSILPGDALCQQPTGSAQAVVATGRLPFTYHWSNDSTTQTISGLTPGYYSCTITDGFQCSVVKTGLVQASSPIQLGLSVEPASCLFSSNGSITAAISGATSPYTIQWSNGESSAVDTSLGAGRYYIYIKDTLGCTASSWTDVSYNPYNDSCYCTLTGAVYLDTTNTCTYTQGDQQIPNIMIHAQGFGYTYTNAYGVYSIKVPSGTYTLSEGVQVYYPLASCQNNAIPVTVTASAGCVDTFNFANVINPIHDVQINTCKLNDPIPGNTYVQKVVVKNNGSVTENNVQLTYQDDGQLSLVSVAPSLFNQVSANYYDITNGFPSLAPGASQAFDITYNVPADIPLGTSVLFQDTTAYTAPISNWLNDYTPWNNVNYYTNTVIGSFDPNSKEVSPMGTGVPGYISQSDSVLTYTVHFQNTGTSVAENIVVIDTLSSNLDLTTMLPIYSNFPYTATMSESGVATFTFSNIDLPDSSGNQLASIGILMYSVHQKKGLQNGAVITSPAYVYFDYNAPVETNSTLNTLGSVCNGFAIDSISTKNVTCSYDSNGSIIIIETGGTGPIQYSIDSGAHFIASDTIMNLPPNTYNIVIKDSNNCQVYAGGPVNISAPVVDTPVIALSGGNDTLSTGNFTTYQWYRNDTSLGSAGSTQSIVANVNGFYTVQVTDANGCTSTSQPYVQKLLGISQPASGESFTVYPNPAQDNLNLLITSNNAVSSCTLKIYDVLGNVVQLRTISLVQGSNQFSADVSSFNSGLYFVELSNGQNLQVQKFNVVR